MKKITTNQAVKLAYKNLYTSKIKNIDRNLDNLLKVKKIASIENGRRFSEEQELEK